MKNKVIFPHEEIKIRNNFLKYAIENRDKLNQIIIEDYKPGVERCHNRVEIETDENTIEALNKEARKLGLDLYQYIRGIFYTTAYEVNQEREKIWKENEERSKEATPFYIGESYISQKLKRNLESKYGKPKNTLFGVNPSVYTDMLVKVAEEYFNIN